MVKLLCISPCSKWCKFVLLYVARKAHNPLQAAAFSVPAGWPSDMQQQALLCRWLCGLAQPCISAVWGGRSLQWLLFVSAPPQSSDLLGHDLLTSSWNLCWANHSFVGQAFDIPGTSSLLLASPPPLHTYSQWIVFRIGTCCTSGINSLSCCCSW